jgi:peptidoglycan/xylan/chitin deacetylase (PgdA/CDA1 family)
MGNWGEYSPAWRVIVNGLLLPAPALIAPPDASTTPDLTPSFDWADVPGADHYRIQVDDNADFSSPAADSEPSASAYTPINQLPNGTYYWHVRTNDGMGNWGEYSPAWRVIVNGTLPSSPTLIAPPDSSTTPDFTPPFDWADVPGADHYRIQVDDNADFSSPAADSEPTASAYTPGNQLPNGTYFWHVRANDGMGNWGEYSPAWRVIVNGTLPPAPALIAPPDGSTTPDLTPSFDWSDVPGADHYRIQIDDNPDFSSPTADSEPTASAYTPGNQLANRTYFWRVRTNDGMGNWGEYSPAWRVIVNGTLPPAPALIAPPDGSTTPDLTPLFDWSDVPGADHFRIQIDDNADFSSPIADSEPSASAYTPGYQLPNGTYFWHVRANDGMGNWGEYSPVWTLNVAGASLPAPTLVSPPDSSTTPDFTPSFDWSDVPGAHHYRIQIDDNADFSSPIADSQPTNSAYTPRTKLVAGTYYWRVRAADRMGNWGGYSHIWRLMVTPVPTEVPTPTPSPAPVPTPLPNLELSNVSDSASLPIEASKTVYLTFDDGPDPSYTPQLVTYLQQRDVQATFFLTGSRRTSSGGELYVTCASSPGDLVSIDALNGKRVVEVIDESGFGIGLHGWFHGSIVHPQDLWSNTGFDVRTNIAQEENALAILGISFDRFLRAPAGVFPSVPFPTYQDWYYYGWDINSGDDYGTPPQVIVDHVLDGLSGMPDGPIILLHAGRPHTLQAIVDPRYDLIGKIMSLGYTRFDRLPRPIDHTGYPPNGALYATGP